MPATKSLLKSSRLLHLYLGVFATPALIFFAFTGFLQTFSFHETTRGSAYKPPKIFVQLGQLHKKQTLVVPERKPPAQGRPAAEKPAIEMSSSEKPSTKVDTSDGGTDPRVSRPGPTATPSQGPLAPKNTLWPMKIFFATVSISLLLSTLTGLYMSYKYVRNKALVTAFLVAGAVIPIVLTLL